MRRGGPRYGLKTGLGRVPRLVPPVRCWERTTGRKALGDGRATGQSPAERRQARLGGETRPRRSVMRELAVAWEDHYPRARPVGRPRAGPWRAKATHSHRRKAAGRVRLCPSSSGERSGPGDEGQSPGGRLFAFPIPSAEESLYLHPPYRAFLEDRKANGRNFFPNTHRRA